jgi:hypothetical protein
MGWRRTAALLGVLVLSVGCAPTPRATPAERIEFYRAHAGEPVNSFRSPGRLWGWRAVGDSALTVWTRHDRGFLLDLTGRCPEMPFATSIGLTNQGGRVSAGFDSVLIPRRAGTGGPASCRIRTIRPLETGAVTESKRDLQDVDVVDRDPSIPDEPAANPGDA